MRVTVVGGGNIGTQFAVHFAEKGHEVIVYTSDPALFSKRLSIVDENGNETHSGIIVGATNEPEKAFRHADWIIVTVPAMMMRSTSDVIEPYCRSGMVICIVPGNGGGDCAFKRCIDKGAILCGIERVPAIARLVEKGKTVRSVGYRDTLKVSSIPIKSAEMCADLFRDVFEKNVVIIPCFLNLTLTPSNPILHTTRLRVMFGDWGDGVTYDRIPLFYEEWDDKTSELMLKCDDEVQTICRALKDFDLSYVSSLKDHYGCYTAESMTQKIAGIPAFKGIMTPMIPSGNGFIPDLHSRYFTADFSYGLTIIRQAARLAEVDTPYIDDVMEWYNAIRLEKAEFSFSDYGMNDVDGLKEFYLR